MNDFPNMAQRFDPNGGLVEFGDDSKLWAQFYIRPRYNAVKSQQEGCPVHDPIVHVRIQQPGERDCYDQPATDLDKRRFGRQWTAFVESREDIPEGTPLSMLFPNNPEIVESLKLSKVHTVQSLANLNDTQMQNIGMGGLTFREKARQYLATADKGKEFHELTARLDKAELDRKADKDRIAALEAALAEASAKTDTKRGKAA